MRWVIGGGEQVSYYVLYPSMWDRARKKRCSNFTLRTIPDNCMLDTGEYSAKIVSPERKKRKSIISDAVTDTNHHLKDLLLMKKNTSFSVYNEKKAKYSCIWKASLLKREADGAGGNEKVKEFTSYEIEKLLTDM